jgi:membrane protein
VPSVKERISAVRERRPFVDHLVRMQEHYGAVKAGQQAGAVTYFAFLSFFPILALAVFVVGQVARIYPKARADLATVVNDVMPGLVGPDESQIQIADIEKFAATIGLIGLLVLLYSGLGWLAAMRAALVVVFEVPATAQPNFVFGKLRDLLTLVLIGVILLLSVAVAGLVGGFATDLLRWLEVGTEYDVLVKVLTALLGFAANMLLFFTMFVLLAEPPTPRRSLWQGAVLGALAFEVLRQISTVLFKSTQGNPAFQAFGIALIVLVWINYFSRVVLYAAAFAHTSRAARALRVPEPAAPVAGPPSPPLAARPAVEESAPAWVTPYAAGAVSTLGLMAVARKLTRRTTRKKS